MPNRILTLLFVSTTCITGAQAAVYTVSSTITDVRQLVYDAAATDPVSAGYQDTLSPASMVYSGTFDLTVTGDSYVINSGSLSMDGSYVEFEMFGFAMGWSYNGVRGAHDMTEGVIDVSANGEPFYSRMSMAESAIDYSAPSFCFALNFVGDCVDERSLSGIDLDAGVVTADGSIRIALAGVPTDPFNLDALTAATTNLWMDGFDILQFQQGYITLTPEEVPVPAAAWLFGSALLGLAGVGRRR